MKLNRNARYSLALSCLALLCLSVMLLRNTDPSSVCPGLLGGSSSSSFLFWLGSRVALSSRMTDSSAGDDEDDDVSGRPEDDPSFNLARSFSGAISNMRLILASTGLQAGSPPPPDEKTNSDTSSQGPLVPGRWHLPSRWWRIIPSGQRLGTQSGRPPLSWRVLPGGQGPRSWTGWQAAPEENAPNLKCGLGVTLQPQTPRPKGEISSCSLSPQMPS